MKFKTSRHLILSTSHLAYAKRSRRAATYIKIRILKLIYICLREIKAWKWDIRGVPFFLVSLCSCECNKTSVFSYRFARSTIPSDGKAGDLQMHPSRHGVFQYPFRYVCDISKRDWASSHVACTIWHGIYSSSQGGLPRSTRGAHSLRMNTPKGSCMFHTHD
ncbi:hypothetical protein F4804DRAFT_269492 [Jackrogersella minutella]|nr:hypothetical protein F4804DRAFT_269492 [Jackrogersella minutella]